VFNVLPPQPLLFMGKKSPVPWSHHAGAVIADLKGDERIDGRNQGRQKQTPQAELKSAHH